MYAVRHTASTSTGHTMVGHTPWVHARAIHGYGVLKSESWRAGYIPNMYSVLVLHVSFVYFICLYSRKNILYIIINIMMML